MPEFRVEVKAKRIVVEGAGIWTWREPELGEYKALRFLVEKAATVYLVLGRAREAFANGTANYADGANQIGTLVEESNKAALGLRASVVAADRWFDGQSPGKPLSTAFEGELDAHLDCIQEWLASFRPKPEVLGNSSRAPSASSGGERPETAGSAGSSSSTPTGGPPGPGSEKPRRSRPKAAGSAPSPATKPGAAASSGPSKPALSGRSTRSRRATGT